MILTKLGTLIMSGGEKRVVMSEGTEKASKIMLLFYLSWSTNCFCLLITYYLLYIIKYINDNFTYYHEM